MFSSDFFHGQANFFTWFLFVAVCLLCVFAAFMVVFSASPVASVLYLILLFTGVAILFVVAGAEFLGAILVIVYVGAIAVLFLFAVMMLNVNRVEFVGVDFYFLVSVGVAIGVFFVVKTNLADTFVFPEVIVKTAKSGYVDWVALPAWKNNAEVLGSLLYTYYAPLFMLAGFVLLVAMVASIILTLGSVQIRHSKIQNKHKQINTQVPKALRLRA